MHFEARQVLAQHDTCLFLADGCPHPVRAIVCHHEGNADVLPDNGAVVTLAESLFTLQPLACASACSSVQVMLFRKCCSNTYTVCRVHMVVTLNIVCQIWQSEIQVQLHAVSDVMHAGCIVAVLTLTDAHRYNQVFLSVHDSFNM